ncbi:MAG: cell division protein SepF [Candidatus Nanopelagicales bacterium]|jgi:cell division inhibitor SepF|nr:cell division protein SepF [Actinomycetota bacterium]MBT5181998.1 cell division protein SepF [Actinomycetota bacterium]MBT5502019.1 cell division protein SepF [Actinomycetota bacterium]MBT5806506.1 cell division protein SepF [Actinomycetota bacterium]MDA9334167.1 cell division protein SepF [Actinomycetota bacterium]
MASSVRRMAVYLGLVEDDSYSEDYADEGYDDPRSSHNSSERYESRVHTSNRAGSSRGFADGYGSDSAESSQGSRVREPRGVRTIRREQELPSRNVAPSSPTPPRNLDFARIESIHPRSYNDARRIGEEYREGIPVIMNLSDLDDSDAKRIIDFAAGLVFGCRGSIERVTNKVFLLSPVNVDVGDQARAQVAQDGFFNQS